MSKKMLLLLLCCSVLLTLGVKVAMSRRAPRQVPYTIVWRVTTTDANGNAEEDYTETRYVSSNGNWHTIKQYPDGQTQEGFAEVGRGVFALSPKHQKMFFLSGHDVSKADAESLRQSPNFVRTETILGYTAYVSKQVREGTTLEVYRVPELDGAQVKHVFNNGSATVVFEPVSILAGELAADKLRHKEYPMDNGVYTETHGEAPQ
ncbi:MAG TPA: hypothetical protein VF544_07105 [Pyrinomonadaceae bacterium]|jgi:hypothetical protein